MNGYTQKRRGAVEHLRDGRFTLLEYGAHDLILALADKETGIWWGSAKALAANCGAGDVSERQARHLLESLELNGYIKRFAKKRGHGNYPILSNKYEVTFGTYKGMRLNAEKTTDWQNPVYEFCFERGLEQDAASGSEEGGAVGRARAPFREGDSRKEKEKEKEKEQERKRRDTEATAAIATVQFSSEVTKAFQALGYEQPFGSLEFQSIWTDEYGQAQNPNPNWTDVMERTIVRCQSTGAKIPPLFFSHKRQIERIELEERFHRTPM